MYAKNYGPYEWKRDALGFDLMRLTPWLQRVHHSDDLDFQEALIEYVACGGVAWTPLADSIRRVSPPSAEFGLLHERPHAGWLHRRGEDRLARRRRVGCARPD